MQETYKEELDHWVSRMGRQRAVPGPSRSTFRVDFFCRRRRHPATGLNQEGMVKKGLQMKSSAIHILRKQIGLSEERYRAILHDAAGVSSSRELTPEGVRTVYLRLKRLSLAETRTARYVWVLWGQLQPYLPASDRNGAWLAGFIRKCAKCKLEDLSDLSALTGKEAHRTIEALKLRLEHEREKVAQEVPF